MGMSQSTGDGYELISLAERAQAITGSSKGNKPMGIPDDINTTNNTKEPQSTD
jgi:hypothetical protein